jgi:hypothetical protein
MRPHQTILFFCILFVASACKEDLPKDEFVERLDNVAAHLEEKNKIYGFVYPDSILTLPIVATYYELHYDAHSVIYYTDTTKTVIKVARYFADSTLLTDKLRPTKFNEFRSLVNNAEYVLDDEHVNYIFEEHGLGHSYEHMRTDGNRY